MLIDFVLSHWVSVTVGAAGGLLTWWASNVLGNPLVAFWLDRHRVLELIQEHWTVTALADEQRRQASLDALRRARAILLAHAADKGWAVRLYCAVRRYDLHDAAHAISGIRELVMDSHSITETRQNTRDFALLKLGATSGMSRQRKADLLAMSKESSRITPKV